MTSLASRLKELEAKATPGEWEIYGSNSWRRIGLKSEYKEILWPCIAGHDGHPDLSGRNRDNDLALLLALRNALPEILEALESTDSNMTAYWKREAERREDWRPLVQPQVAAATKVLKERAEAAEQRVAELEREAGYAIDLLREIKHDLHMRAELNEDRDSDTGAIVLALSSGLVRRLNDTINPPASRTEGRK